MSDFFIRLLKCFFISSQSLKDYEHRRWNNDFRLFKITIPRNVKIFVNVCQLLSFSSIHDNKRNTIAAL